MKKIILTVTTDLVFDQRMKRICGSLSKNGYQVQLVGREKKKSPPLANEPYKQVRLRCFFEKGKLFYLEYNIRLFLYLLRQKTDVFCGIDLDTLLPAFLVAKIKSAPLVYDAHEYFTEMEEVVPRKMVKWVWKSVEKLAVPHCAAAYTVSNGYAQLFENEYPTKFEIVRNVTILKEEFPYKKTTRIILYQGAVNHGRGLFNVVKAMKQVEGQLIICGMGDVHEDLVQLTKDLNLEDKVTFTGYLKPAELLKYTKQAQIGLTLFEAEGLSNRFSLANRFFDYFHSGVPQLAMNYPEYVDFNKRYEVANLLENLAPNTIAKSINQLLDDESYYNQLFENTLKARKEVNWQSEEKTLIGVYQKIFSPKS